MLSFVGMDKVLPKESERELQLRLEAEAEDQRNLEAEEIFADKIVKKMAVLVRRR